MNANPNEQIRVPTIATRNVGVGLVHTAVALVALGLSACSAQERTALQPKPSLSVAPVTAQPSVATPGTGTSARPAPAGSIAPPGAEERPTGSACGALQCQLFDSPAQALREILKTSPRVIAFGESHAQRGSEGVESSALRFMRDFLPVLKETSSDLVLELMVADGSCGAKTEAKVEAKQKPVTAPQRESNQNEFLVLGQACQAAGVRPHVIRPSCGDYKRIAQAGDDSIDQMLTLIADESARLVRAILERNLKQGKDRTVLTYGGALHNDILPRAGYEAWSFGPRLSKLVGGRYIEIDLIVREFIRDTETWKAMPWYAHFDKTAHPQRVTLFRPTPQSYALIFAASGPPHESGATGAGTAPPSGVAGTSAPSRGRHP